MVNQMRQRFGALFRELLLGAPLGASGVDLKGLDTIWEGFPSYFAWISDAFFRYRFQTRCWDLHLIWGPAVARRKASSIFIHTLQPSS